MIEIIFIEIVSIVSFLYATFILVMPSTFIGTIGSLFIWTILSSILYAYLIKKHKLYNLSILLLLAPLIYFRETKAIIFIIATSLIIFFYINNSLFKGNYFIHADKIKKSYLLFVPLIYLRFMLDGFVISIGGAIPFIIIFIFSSIILLRTIRHLDSNMGMKTIRKNNIKNIFILTSIFPIIFFQNLRDIIRVFFDKSLSIISYPLAFIGKIIGNILELILGQNKDIQEEIIIGEGAGEISKMPVEEFGETVGNVATDYTILKNIFFILFLILVIYSIYRILRNSGKSTFEDTDYVELREYIKDDKKKRNMFKRDKYPSNPAEQIRYYYRRFLNKIDKSGIQILKTDTSIEINEKANEVYQKDISRIREIYINSRYSNSEAEEKDVKEMEELCRKL